PDVSPVIIAEKDENVIINTQPFIVIVLYFFVNGPNLWRLVRRLAGNFGQDLSLVGDNSFQQVDSGFVAHGLIAIASHADGDDTLIVSHAFNTAAPELTDLLCIGFIVPRPAIVAAPFFVVAHHGLMVRGRNDDPVFVRNAGILRVVGGKDAWTPHRRPEVVRLVSQDQLKNLFIKRVIK